MGAGLRPTLKEMGAKIRWSGKAFREFKRRVKRLTSRSWFMSMEYRMKQLAQYLRGWMNYFGISDGVT